MEHPRFATVEEYGKRFMDVDYWQPYVAAVCEQCGLTPCNEIRSGLPGTYPVFIVDQCYVVKFFGEFFSGGARFLVELALYELLAYNREIPAPTLVVSGTLFRESAGWLWPYIVMRAIPGENLRESEERITYQNKLAICHFLGPIVRRIHDLKPPHSSRLRLGWEAFDHFLAVQKVGCNQNHRRWGSLPKHLIAQLTTYIPPVTELIDYGMPPHVLHCDLNADHVLGHFVEDDWQPTGIIDFGDAMVGDPMYELVALHIGLFHCDKQLLRTFLQEYGSEEGLRRDFVRKAMSMTLLHEFDVLGEVFSSFPGARNVAHLSDLADVIWNLESPTLI